MKNFSELQAISPELEVHIELAVITHNGAPWTKVMINDSVLLDQELAQSWQAQHRVSSLEALQIKVEMRGKRYSDQLETAVVIQRLQVAGFDIVADHCHHARYLHDHEPRPVSHYLGFNGVWCLDTETPFYEWQHQICGMGWLLKPITA